MNFYKIIKSYKSLLVITITVVVIYIYSADYCRHVRRLPLYNVTTLYANSNSNSDANSNTKIALTWTKWFRDPWPYRFDQFNCTHNNCVFTANRELLNKSVTVLFHWRDIIVDDIPHTRYANQTWIMFTAESPANMKYSEELKYFYDQINWTMTYRLDSDIVRSYGDIVKCDNRDRKLRFRFENKTKSIAWIVSNCDTFSKREKYVSELKKYIDIDIYGNCGPLRCSRDESCLETIEKNYKFYLSFENSICKDYVTEKLFKIIKYDIIPVVLGGANYSQLMPENSYIDVFNFSSPKLLAQYLTKVGNDEQLYESYFTWKTYYCGFDSSQRIYCDLCYKLNFPHSFQKSLHNTNLVDWWYKQGNCSSLYQYKNVFERLIQWISSTRA